jgi:hypothetical protein
VTNYPADDPKCRPQVYTVGDGFIVTRGELRRNAGDTGGPIVHRTA